MADLISQQKLPTPVAPIATGNAKADVALNQLLVWPRVPAHPSPRPFGKDYDKACKVARTAGAAALLEVLAMKGMVQAGSSTWNEEAYDKLSPAKKKQYSKLSEAASEGRKVRYGFLLFLVEAVLPEGYQQLLAMVANRKLDPELRYDTLRQLRSKFDDKKHLLEMVRSVEISEWNSVDKAHLAEELIECWHEADPEAAFAALRKHVTVKDQRKKYFLIDAILTTIERGDVEVDPRWAPHLATMVTSDHARLACQAILALPVDPKVLPVITKVLGKATSIEEELAEVVARLGTMATVPILTRAIQDDPDTADDIIDKVPNKAVRAALKAVPLEPEEEAGRERPTLVFRKTKPFKFAAIPALAKQEAQYKKLFADAGIADAYKIVQRSVALVPTCVDEKSIKVGATKLGGHPDLPRDVTWPRIENEPMTFLAQLNLADFAALGELPKTGTLAVFASDDPTSDVGYLQHARVIYSKGAKLERREVPEDYVASIYQACKVKLVDKLSLPSPTNAQIKKLISAAAIATYESEVFAHTQDLPIVLGYRDYWYDTEPATARVLLQLPGDNQSGMQFGDADALSIYIGVKDLAKGNFTKVWPKVGD